MDPLDPGCCGCCLFLPMPKFLQRWMGTSFEITNPKKIAAWADTVFDGSPTVMLSLYKLPVGIGVLHQVADERGYRFTEVADDGIRNDTPQIWRFDLIEPTTD